MKEGHVLLHTNTLILMGVAGSGKTSVKELLLDNPISELRNSTPCRDRILHVRPITNHLFRSTSKSWKEIGHQDMIDLLAKAVRYLPRSSLDKLSNNLQSKLKQIPSSTASSSKPCSSSPTSDSPIEQAISAITDHVIKAMGTTTSSQGANTTQIQKGNELFGTKTIRVTDNGGQPQFHDIASLFIRHASAGLFVFRLTDDFCDFPFDDLYKDGKLVGTPSLSHLSHGETIMSLLRSFLSHGHNPILIFVGTFLDKINDPKIVSDKNRQLLELLPPELKNEVVYSDCIMDKVIFTLNAIGRDTDTQAVAEQIRLAVETAPSFDIEVPLWWFIIELSLQHLRSTLGRGVLRWEECAELSLHLGFDVDALGAALVYFDKMCIVHYYPEILPDIVFVNPQVPLDKVSELTQHAISLREAIDSKDTPRTTSAVSAKWKKFRDQGILTVDMFESQEFQKHFEEDLFTPAHMIAIMRELLIIAPLSNVASDSLPLSQMEFFMPTLLRSVPPSELEEHRVFNLSADPLLLRFESGCIRCGIFCCLVVFLMKMCGWKVCMPSGEPVLLARNCVKFQLPKDPATVTLIDSFSFIEVHIDARSSVCQCACPSIRQCVLEGVTATSKTLHYDDDVPVSSFFCPCKERMQEAAHIGYHYADIYLDYGLWRCPRDIKVDGNLKDSHLVWLSCQKHAIDGKCLYYYCAK